jgi:hypothetical protein
VTLDVELFGSPINHNLSKYCSLFPDIEKDFGSIGSIFCIDKKIWNANKYFVANPPFDELIMLKMTLMTIEVLNTYDNCCFIFIIPDWRSNQNDKYKNVSYETYDILTSSKHKKIEVILQPSYYDYFTSKYISIGSTKTIVLVLSNFDIPLIKDDFYS